MEDRVTEDVENTSLPAHVALCNERALSMDKWLQKIDGELERLRADFKKATFALLALLMTIAGTLIYVMLDQHLVGHALT